MTTSPTPVDPKTNVRVAVRVRPFTDQEIEHDVETLPSDQCTKPVVRLNGRLCSVDGDPPQTFSFDHGFWSVQDECCLDAASPFATQSDVYDSIGPEMLGLSLQGINTCAFAYGPTGTGKSFTALGTTEEPGLARRFVRAFQEHIRRETEASNAATTTVVECELFEIYGEKVRDLFAQHKSASFTLAGKSAGFCFEQETPLAEPRIRRHPTHGVSVEGLRRERLDDTSRARAAIDRGLDYRIRGSSHFTDSSRSHVVFQLHVTTFDTAQKTQRTATLSLVDLAGSEDHVLGDDAQAKREARSINASSATLRACLSNMVHNSSSRTKRPLPTKDSVLTSILRDVLHGDAYVWLIATASPHASEAPETLRTLQFALRTRAVVCSPIHHETTVEDAADAAKLALATLRQRGALFDGGQEAMANAAKEVDALADAESIVLSARRDSAPSLCFSEGHHADPEKEALRLALIEAEDENIALRRRVQELERLSRDGTPNPHAPPAELRSSTPGPFEDNARSLELDDPRDRYVMLAGGPRGFTDSPVDSSPDGQGAPLLAAEPEPPVSEDCLQSLTPAELAVVIEEQMELLWRLRRMVPPVPRERVEKLEHSVTALLQRQTVR